MVIKKFKRTQGVLWLMIPVTGSFFTVFSFASNKALQYWSCRCGSCVFSVKKFYSLGKRNTNKKRCNDFANLLITITVFFIFVFFIMSKKKCQSCNHNLQMNFRYMSTQSFFTLSQLSLLGQTEKKSECKKIK